MTGVDLLLALAVFGACLVESVEALTVVLAASRRGVRPALLGAGAALVLLAGAVAVAGVPLVLWVPLRLLQVGVGAVLLYVGTQWLRKAVLRASGRKALHDEDAIYTETLKSKAAPFAVAFQGVLVEGLEVLVIVVSLGAGNHRLGLAAGAAVTAVVLVAAVGVLVARQLSEVPENTIKLAVGIMVCGFGVFTLGEGAGLKWPGADLSLLAIIALVYGATRNSIHQLRHSTHTKGARNDNHHSSEMDKS